MAQPNSKTHSTPWCERGDEEMWRQLQLTPSMTPFLMALTSPSDHWGFVSSTGGLTLGRVEAERAIFPFETDDRLHRGHQLAGPQTWIELSRSGDIQGVDPWGHRAAKRSLFKHRFGHQLVFEAVLEDIGVTFSYRWAPSTELGWIRTCWLSLHDPSSSYNVRIFDGLLGLMPPQVDLATYQGASCLVDAYRRAELIDGTSCALISLESQISDRPEPRESLKANLIYSVVDGAMEATAWDLNPARLSPETVDEPQRLRLGCPSAYVMDTRVTLNGERPVTTWSQVIDVHLDHHTLVARLDHVTPSLDARGVDLTLRQTTDELEGFVHRLDGLQHSADLKACARHTMSALFNGMRGGVPLSDMTIDTADFERYVASRCKPSHARLSRHLETAPSGLTRDVFIAWSEGLNDHHLARLALEYLPLSWARRHGGPSRPWNRFAIQLTDDIGGPRRYYEGNWRDIFQNWEALAWSYPSFLESMLARFVGASSADGFNPYRITRDGLDWEVPEQDNPWAHIGYWGDHQGPYLCRLVEMYRRVWPTRIAAMALKPRYGYVDIPYRLTTHDLMFARPKQTVRFDHERHDVIMRAVEQDGEDRRLLHDVSGQVWQVNLIEKLLVAALGRMGQLVVGGGVWMSTQRPEWNDANNALAGDGLSVVSTAYLYRFLGEIQSILCDIDVPAVDLSESVATWLSETTTAYGEVASLPDPNAITPEARRRLLDAVALPYERHRTRLYMGHIGPLKVVPVEMIHALLTRGRSACKATLEGAQRADGLFDAYRMMRRDGDGGIEVSSLPLMLEGQVAALSAHMMPAERACEVLETLFESGLYRPDQQSFTLMVPHTRPSFLARNMINVDALEPGTRRDASQAGIISQDGRGGWRFSANIESTEALEAALEHTDWPGTQREALRRCFEVTFNHDTFLGRSGTMYAYEGIGCIYWHMVAKLLVATQEVEMRARATGEPERTIQRISTLYHRVRDGLGFRRSPESYGAFPTDPYSHTPGSRGAQQPGMTGLVKEDLISRYSELGVRIQGGELFFAPTLLKADEFIADESIFLGVSCPAGSLGFSLAGVVVIYTLGETQSITLTYPDERTEVYNGCRLPGEQSRRWLSRDASRPSVARVSVDRTMLWHGA